jgi:hypothetical protein
MDSVANTENIQEVEKQTRAEVSVVLPPSSPLNDKKSDSDVKYMKLGNITYEVVYNYVGKQSMLDIIKAGIRRDIESGNY